jgi:hypothetical protein
VWRDPEWGPRAAEMLAREEFLADNGGDWGDYDPEDPWALHLEELPELLDEPQMPPEVAASVLAGVAEVLGEAHESLPRWVAGAIAFEALDPANESAARPRLVNVPKDLAEEFIAEHHSKLPTLNYRGLLYAIGVEARGRLAAVATATTPSGQFRGRGGCTPDGVLELSRIASDGRVKGASSMLAARLIDLLPASGRRGAGGCLFVTYSLLGEHGTTYLALVDKGLRPTARIRGKKPGGSRRHAGGAALGHEDKIVWEAGPAALPPDWSVLEGHADPKQLAGAVKNFNAREERLARLAQRARARVA